MFLSRTIRKRCPARWTARSLREKGPVIQEDRATPSVIAPHTPRARHSRVPPDLRPYHRRQRHQPRLRPRHPPNTGSTPSTPGPPTPAALPRRPPRSARAPANAPDSAPRAGSSNSQDVDLHLVTGKRPRLAVRSRPTSPRCSDRVSRHDYAMHRTSTHSILELQRKPIPSLLVMTERSARPTRDRPRRAPAPSTGCPSRSNCPRTATRGIE